jgi:hypothetical protein
MTFPLSQNQQQPFPFQEKPTKINLHVIFLECLSELRVIERSDDKKYERRRSLKGWLE